MDFVLKRYHDPQYVLGMQYLEFIDLLSTAYQEENEKQMFEVWKAMLPGMTLGGSIISFADFKKQIEESAENGEPLTEKTAEEIVAEIQAIKANDERRDESNGTV